MQLEAIKHTDVRGRELMYLRVTNSKGNSLLINVGLKTFGEVSKMNEEEREVEAEKLMEILERDQLAPDLNVKEQEEEHRGKITEEEMNNNKNKNKK